MKKACFFLFVLLGKVGQAQTVAFSNEGFVNAVFHEVVDSTVAAYYLSASAYPCSFIKFDYNEWYTYALKEDVPIYILNELAEKSQLDAKPVYWRQEQLHAADCIDEEKIGAVFTTSLNTVSKKRNRNRVENKLVYFFSRPEFTADGQYGVIDMSYRCDNHLCGMGATFLFRQVNGKWRLVGRKLVWGS
jgi:hypothetical protein